MAVARAHGWPLLRTSNPTRTRLASCVTFLLTAMLLFLCASETLAQSTRRTRSRTRRSATSAPAATTTPQAPAPPTPTAPAASTPAPPAQPPTPAERLSDPRRRPRGYNPSTSLAFLGPRVEIGWMHYRFDDRASGGSTDALVFAGYAPFKSLRLGALLQLGIRDYALGAGDAIVGVQAMAGYQYVGRALGPVVPYVVGTASLGAVIGKRFHTSFADSFYGLGFEVGLDLNLVRTLFLGAGIGYQRVQSDGLAYDWVTLRFTIGL